jgi:hypothetical protein
MGKGKGKVVRGTPSTAVRGLAEVLIDARAVRAALDGHLEGHIFLPKWSESLVVALEKGEFQRASYKATLVEQALAFMPHGGPWLREAQARLERVIDWLDKPKDAA